MEGRGGTRLPGVERVEDVRRFGVDEEEEDPDRDEERDRLEHVVIDAVPGSATAPTFDVGLVSLRPRCHLISPSFVSTGDLILSFSSVMSFLHRQSLRVSKLWQTRASTQHSTGCVGE